MIDDPKIEISAEDVEITWDDAPEIPNSLSAAQAKVDALISKPIPQIPEEAAKAGKALGEALVELEKCKAAQTHPEEQNPSESKETPLAGKCQKPDDSLKLREKWLGEAWTRLTGLEVGFCGEPNEKNPLSISCGYGKGGNRSNKTFSFHKDLSNRVQLFIHPDVSTKEGAIDALIKYAYSAHYCTTPGESVLGVMPPYPQSKLAEDEKAERKDGIRQLKVVCLVCGYTARTSRKWLDKAGEPFCPSHHTDSDIKNLPVCHVLDMGGGVVYVKMVEADKPLDVELEADSAEKNGEVIEVTTKKQ